MYGLTFQRQTLNDAKSTRCATWNVIQHSYYYIDMYNMLQNQLAFCKQGAW